MKNNIIAVFVLLSFLYACKDKHNVNSNAHKQSQKKQDYLTIEANIKTDRTKPDNIYMLLNPLSFSLGDEVVKTMFLDNNGHLKDSIRNIKPGYYILMSSLGRTINLYLKAGDHIKIKTNALSDTSFTDSLKVSSSHIVNSFLSDYQRVERDNFQDDIKSLFSLKEKPFKAKMDSLKRQLFSYVEKYKGLSKQEKKTAKDNILYSWASALDKYPVVHAEIKKQPNYKPSKNYFDYIKGINLNNVTLFKSNFKYRNYVSERIVEQIYASYKPTKQESQIDFFLKKAKKDHINPYIKDFILLKLAEQYIFFTAPSYQQYSQNVLRRFQKQVKALKTRNPKAKTPLKPTKEQLRQDYKKYVAEYAKLYQENYNKVLANVDTPEFRKALKLADKIVKGLKKGDPAPKIQVLKNNKPADLIALNKGKNLLIYFWTSASDDTSRFFDDYNRLAQTFEKNPNIVFATVDIDYKNKKDKWQLMVKEKKLKGQSYMTSEGWDAPFLKSSSFKIFRRQLPMFVLINSEGNILVPGVDNPNDKKLKKELSNFSSAASTN